MKRTRHASKAPAKILAYVRVSTDRQDADNQRLEILNYAQNHGFIIDDFISITISTRRDPVARRIDELMEMLNPGDTLIVSELSRLGRSVGQVATLVDKLINKHVKVIALKENITLNGDGKKDVQTTVMVTMFSLFAEIERQLISERTKAGLAAARAKGKLLGRPKGSLGKTKLDGKEEMIREELKYRVPKSAIARKFGVSRTCLVHFIETRGLEK